MPIQPLPSAVPAAGGGSSGAGSSMPPARGQRRPDALAFALAAAALALPLALAFAFGAMRSKQSDWLHRYPWKAKLLGAPKCEMKGEDRKASWQGEGSNALGFDR